MPSAHAYAVGTESPTHLPHPPKPRRKTDLRRLASTLRQMAPTTLAQLDAVSLLNRVDTKYVLPVSHVRAILPSLARDYHVLEVDGRRLHRYRTLYFDTPTFALYRAHQAGRTVRHKVRSRAYLDTGLAFLEIKSKISRRRTVKQRLATSELLTDLTPETRAFVESHLRLDARALQPTVQNELVRVTLVGGECAERLTLDLDIQFDYDGRTVVLPRLAIAELKQSHTDDSSPFIQLMRTLQVQPVSVSKYCVGAALLVDGIERDAFQGTLAAIEAVTRDAGDGPRTGRLPSWLCDRRTTHDAAS